MSATKSSTGENVGVSGTTGSTNIYDPERAALQSQIAQELNGPGSVTGSNALDTGYGTTLDPYIPGSANGSLSNPRWGRSVPASGVWGYGGLPPGSTVPPGTGTPPPGTGTPPPGTGTPPPGTGTPPPGTGTPPPGTGTSPPGIGTPGGPPGAPTAIGLSTPAAGGPYSLSSQDQLAAPQGAPSAQSTPMSAAQAQQFATEQWYTDQIGQNMGVATLNPGQTPTAANYPLALATPEWNGLGWYQPATGEHTLPDSNQLSNPAQWAANLGYTGAAPTQAQLAPLIQNYESLSGTATPQQMQAAQEFYSGLPASAPQNQAAANPYSLSTQNTPAASYSGSPYTLSTGTTPSTTGTGGSPGQMPIIPAGTGTTLPPAGPYIGGLPSTAAGPYTADPGSAYAWGSGGLTGNANQALGSAYTGYEQMYQNPISQQTQQAMTQETMNAANAQTAGAQEQIQRNAAATGNTAGEAAAMAQLGRDRAGIGEQAARQNVIAQDTLANQRQQAALSGISGIGTQEQGAANTLMGLQSNLSGGPVGTQQKLTTSTNLQNDTSGGGVTL
jgi:hypothetical protein